MAIKKTSKKPKSSKIAGGEKRKLDVRNKLINTSEAKTFFKKNVVKKRILEQQKKDLKVFTAPPKVKTQDFKSLRHRDEVVREERIKSIPKLDASQILTKPNLGDHLTTANHKELYQHLPLLSKLEADILFMYLETSSYKEVAKHVNVSYVTVRNCIRKPLVQEYLRINFAEQSRLHQTLNLRNAWDAVESLRTMIKVGTTETKEVLSPTGGVVKLVTKKSPNIDTIKFILEKSGLMPTVESIEEKEKSNLDVKLNTEIDIHLKTVLK